MRIGKIFNIPIILHWSLLIGLGYFAFDLLRSGSPFLPNDLNTGTRIAMALFIASSLFASVLVHELAHSLVAKRLGYVVVDITLMVFGGVSMISSNTRRAMHEFVISIVGPASSLVLSVLAFAILRLGPFESGSLVGGWLIYLIIVNGFIAVFNMLPGLPLDGGRVARSAIWTFTGDRLRATRIAAYGGRAVAVLMAAAAVALMIWQQNLTAGIWVILVAGFLWLGATSELNSAKPDDDVPSGIPIHFIMTRISAVFTLDIPLSEARRYGLQAHPHREIPVIGDGAVLGFVSLTDIEKREADSGYHASTLTVGDVFRRCRTGVVRSDADISVAAEMLKGRVEKLVVFDEGRLVGTIGREELAWFNSAGYEVKF